MSSAPPPAGPAGWLVRCRCHEIRLHGAGGHTGALTAIDCLGYLDEIKVCTGYEIDGKVTTDFPVPALLDRAKPVYETLPGWKCDIRGVTDYGKLPQAPGLCGLH